MQLNDLKPNIQLIKKYFNYIEYERVNAPNDIETKCIKFKDNNIWVAYIEYSEDQLINNYDEIESLFETYNLKNHIDNLLYEAWFFAEINPAVVSQIKSNYTNKYDNMILNLMKLILKYGDEENKQNNYNKQSCSLELKFIRKNISEKFIIDKDDFFVTYQILEAIKKTLLQSDYFSKYFSKNLFLNSNPEDKKKQLEFINENINKTKKGAKSKNILIAKFIINLINYLNNETLIKSKNRKLTSNKQAIFIYDFLTQMKVIVREENEDFYDGDKVIFIRDIVSNYYKKI